MKRTLRLACLVALSALLGCSSTAEKKDLFASNSGGNGGGDGGQSAGSGANPGGGGSVDEAGTPLIDTGTIDPNEGGTISNCQAGPDEDKDHDGYSINQGDCNDCDPNANPGAFDVIGGVDGGVGVDEDCDGTPDNEPTDCDLGIKINDSDAFNGAKAIGLCRRADPNATGKDKTWGVLSAKYVKADGYPGMNPVSHGIVDRFGIAKVQNGERMLVLSSGAARAPGQPGFLSPKGMKTGTASAAPPGYPKESPSCPGVKTGPPKDPAALEVKIRVPTNAKSFSFKLNFYTYEFPYYICSQFNDFYVTMMTPKPAGLSDGNISFDQDGNSISVNNSLLQVCHAQNAGGMGGVQKYFPCPLGPTLLNQTGFDEKAEFGPHAATGWLQTSAPVTPGGVITLRFAIWDSGDEILDSTVLIDDFKWSVEPASAAETKPVDTPK